MRRRDERVAVQFGANLRRIRIREGLTQRGLAARASLHRTEIDKLESGKRCARVDTLIVLAGAMAATAGELLDGIVPGPAD
jgi:transcriptional regulator with XRE-family HTH domain